MNKKVLYGATRLVQRLSLLWMGLITFSYWALLVALTVTASRISGIKDVAYVNAQHQSDFIDSALDGTIRLAVTAIVISVVLTVALSLFAQVRKIEKRLLLDSAAVIIFCAWALLFGHPLISKFVHALT